ncbi:MAG: hypothetical protein MJZ20_10030 [Bacteroidaceae bacterium]|nr:hypothetical protein [Bacteroidaceae bacterium]
MSICKRDHGAIQGIMRTLPVDQGGEGRHKCAACAYEEGKALGKELNTNFNLGEILESLPESQAQEQRHKSPAAAFARGYLDGVAEHYA